MPWAGRRRRGSRGWNLEGKKGTYLRVLGLFARLGSDGRSLRRGVRSERAWGYKLPRHWPTRAGIDGLSRIWLAAWMRTLPAPDSVEVAGPVCVFVCVCMCVRARDSRLKRVGTTAAIRESPPNLCSSPISLSRRLAPLQLSRCSRSSRGDEHGQTGRQTKKQTTWQCEHSRVGSYPPRQLRSKCREPQPVWCQASTQRPAGQRHLTLDPYCPGTEPSRSSRLHLSPSLSGPSRDVAQTPPYLSSLICTEGVLLTGANLAWQATRRKPQHVCSDPPVEKRMARRRKRHRAKCSALAARDRLVDA